MALTKRWTPLTPHAVQLEYWNSPHRFNVMSAGRRSGKTERFKRKLVKAAFRGTSFDTPRFFAAAPTRDQAKKIFWNDLKKLVPRKFMLGRPSESELIIRLVTGSEIHVIGMDRPERIEGVPWDGGGLDEYANMKSEAWGENVRPALSDRGGWCDLFGVPEGRNHYFHLDQFAQSEVRRYGEGSEWGSFTWFSADILPPEEIESAKRHLDPLTYQQEYEGCFVNFQGLAYHMFDRNKHCAKLSYNENDPLIIALDFNVSPGVAAIMQEMKLPNGLIGTGVIGEVFIPRNSNTVYVCNRIINDWSHHKGYVHIYGDATGGAQGSAQIAGSDWALVKSTLKPAFGVKLITRYDRSNPKERVRVNAVNARLSNVKGDIRIMVDPDKAPHVVNDFEGVSLLEGGSGELDKRRTPELTHISDAIGYYINKEFPIEKKAVTVSTY